MAGYKTGSGNTIIDNNNNATLQPNAKLFVSGNVTVSAVDDFASSDKIGSGAFAPTDFPSAVLFQIFPTPYQTGFNYGYMTSGETWSGSSPYSTAPPTYGLETSTNIGDVRRWPFSSDSGTHLTYSNLFSGIPASHPTYPAYTIASSIAPTVFFPTSYVSPSIQNAVTPVNIIGYYPGTQRGYYLQYSAYSAVGVSDRENDAGYAIGGRSRVLRYRYYQQVSPTQFQVQPIAYVLQSNERKIKFSFSSGVEHTGYVTLGIPSFYGNTVSYGSQTEGFVAGRFSPDTTPNVPGLIPGGESSAAGILYKFPFAADTTLAQTGDAHASASGDVFFFASTSSKEKGFTIGGYEFEANTTDQTIRTIASFPFNISSGNATDVGDLANRRINATGVQTEGTSYVAGGFSSGPAGGLGPLSYSNAVEKFPFAISSATATSVASITPDVIFYNATGLSGVDEAFFIGGDSGEINLPSGDFGPATTNDIRKFKYASEVFLLTPFALTDYDTNAKNAGMVN